MIRQRTHPSPQKLDLTARLVVVFVVLLVIAGGVWHGVTEDTLQRLWQNIVDRPSRRMSIRFALQPVMASFVAIRHGIADARIGRSPYLWTILWNPEERVARLRDGLNATARIILIALAIDAAYQILELKMFYPVEAPIIALSLAFTPYVLVRGLAARVARWWGGNR